MYAKCVYLHFPTGCHIAQLTFSLKCAGELLQLMTQRSESWTSLYAIKCQSTADCITKAWSELRGFATTEPRIYIVLESRGLIFCRWDRL